MGSHTFSVIASDVEIIGNLSAKVDLHIDGKIEGDVQCGALVQGSDSIIKGKVTAENARLAGVVEGSIHARDLIIEAQARIQGDVVYETLTIEQGSKVDGKLQHASAGGAPNIHKATINAPKDALDLGGKEQAA
nr:polymer-forming cytoskeletal protein [Sphingorhabdus lutea]